MKPKMNNSYLFIEYCSIYYKEKLITAERVSRAQCCQIGNVHVSYQKLKHFRIWRKITIHESNVQNTLIDLDQGCPREPLSSRI